MKAREPNIKYVEWQSPDELHEISLNWVSELKFIKDEQHFLDELMQNYMLELLSGNVYKKSKKVLNDLSEERKDLEPLFKEIINHHNALAILVDGKDQPVEEKQYKDDHRALIIKVNEYLINYKDTKRKVFELIKTIMKREKQKRLLS